MEFGHVGFTGTRRGMTPPQLFALAHAIHGMWLCEGFAWLHHGDCLGSDREAHDIAKALGLKVHSHPPKNRALRAFCVADRYSDPKGYLERDHDIVDETVRLIAAPGGMCEELRSGTWATIRYAKRLRRPLAIIFPDGSVSNG